MMTMATSTTSTTNAAPTTARESSWPQTCPACRALALDFVRARERVECSECGYTDKPLRTAAPFRAAREHRSWGGVE